MTDFLLYITIMNKANYLYAVQQPAAVRGGALIIERLTKQLPLTELSRTENGQLVYGAGSFKPWGADNDAAKPTEPAWRIAALGGQVAIFFKHQETAQQFFQAIHRNAEELTGDAHFLAAVIVPRAAGETVGAWWQRTRAEACHRWQESSQPQSLTVTPLTQLCESCGERPASALTTGGQAVDHGCAARISMASDWQNLMLEIEKNSRPENDSQLYSFPMAPRDLAIRTEDAGLLAALRIDLTARTQDSVTEISQLSERIFTDAKALELSLSKAFSSLLVGSRGGFPVIAVPDALQGCTVFLAAPLALPLVLEVFNQFKKHSNAQLAAGIAVSAAHLPYSLLASRAEVLLAEARLKFRKHPVASSGDGFVQYHRFRDGAPAYLFNQLQTAEQQRCGAALSGFPMRISHLKELLVAVDELATLRLPVSLAETIRDAICRERGAASDKTWSIINHLSGELGSWFKQRAPTYAAFPFKRKGKDEWWTDLADLMELHMLGDFHAV